MPTNEALLNNRLEFITCHRDKRVSTEGLELFDGAPPFFKNAFVFDEKTIAQVPSEFEIHVPDWAGVDKGVLEKNNWQLKDAMKYVWLEGNADDWKTNAAIKTVKIEQKEDLPLFCQIQSKGFSGNEVEDDPWFPYISKSAERNFGHVQHLFYMAFLDEVPICVTLAFYHKGLAGIYSVTTIEKYRGIGASTSLMKRVVDDAYDAGMSGITLQTMKGSYAEGFYRKMGFEDRFACQIYSCKG